MWELVKVRIQFYLFKCEGSILDMKNSVVLVAGFHSCFPLQVVDCGDA
jgi:hypothetical protein